MDIPLLSSEAVDAVYVNNTPGFLVSSLKWILKTLMWVIFIAWVTLIFLFPAQFMNFFYQPWIQYFSNTPFGITGWQLTFL